MRTASELPRHNSRRTVPDNRKATGNVELGHKLKELRYTYRLSATQVATETGMSNTYLNQLENALSMPSVEKLARLAAFYETTLDELCGHMVEQAKRGGCDG